MRTCKGCPNREQCVDFYLRRLKQTGEGKLLCEVDPSKLPKAVSGTLTGEERKRISKYINQDYVRHNPVRVKYVSPIVLKRHHVVDKSLNPPLEEAYYDAAARWEDLIGRNISIYDFTFIQELTERQRECLLMYIELGSYTEVGKRLRCTPQNVFMRVQKAISRIFNTTGITEKKLKILYFRLQGKTEQWIADRLRVTQPDVAQNIDFFLKLPLKKYFNP
ncbi:MAG: hypothetical protein DRI01_03570 [Chloroflexi bacterium]|nr:MAG: hypothetical protein DRI01_03570 [Chloroflexota bacterium]